MRKRSPKLVGNRKKPVPKVQRHAKEKPYVWREKTKKEKIYDIICKASTKGYRFTDTYYGIPLIELADIEEKEDGIYVLRFRCEPQYVRHAFFGRMAEDVCAALRSGMHFVYELKQEWGIPYAECAWILQLGELDRDVPIWRKFFMAGTRIKGLESAELPKPKKSTHERWEEFLQSHYNKSLADVARELGYSAQNIDLLECNAVDQMQKKVVYKKHKKLFDTFLKSDRNKELMDGRNVLDYFKDLIASWIGEDLLVKALNEYGFTASLANADRDRVIKTNRDEVTGEPDIKIEFEGNTRYLELMDALSPVEKYGQFDLRLSKAKNQFNRKTLFLLHGLADGKYVLIDFLRDNIVVQYNYPNPRFGNKPCSIVRFDDNGITMQPVAVFWESLKDIMVNTKPEPAIHYLKIVDWSTKAVEILGNDGAAASEDSDESDDEASEDTVNGQDGIETQEPAPHQEEATPIEEQEEPEEVESVPKEAVPEELATQEEASEQPESEKELPVPEENDEESIIEEDENGEEIEYTTEQWAALNDIF